MREVDVLQRKRMVVPDVSPGFKFAAECFHDQFTYHVKTAMVPECSKEDQWPVISERRDRAADDVFSLWSRRPDCHRKFFQNRSHPFGNCSKVLINVFCLFWLLIFFHASFLIPLAPSLRPRTCTCDTRISFPYSRRHGHTGYTGTCTRQGHRW